MKIQVFCSGLLVTIATLSGHLYGQETTKAEERIIGDTLSGPYKGRPVKRDLLLQVLRQRTLEERDVLGVIQRNGVDFNVDAAVEKELAAAGAKPKVIAAAKANNRERSAAAVKPTAPTPDPPAAAAPEPVPEEEADLLSDIPSVGATVTSFRFFTADDDLPPPRGSRRYETRFAKAVLKTVYYEFSVLYLTDNSSTFNMTVIWMRNGQQLTRQDLPFTKPRDWATGTRTYGHGFATPGLWDTGKYEVVVEVDGRKVAANMFEVY